MNFECFKIIVCLEIIVKSHCLCIKNILPLKTTVYTLIYLYGSIKMPNMCCQLIDSSRIDVVPKTRKLCGLNRCVSAYTNDSNTNGINGMYSSCMEVGK